MIKNILTFIFISFIMWWTISSSYYGFKHPEKTQTQIFLDTHKHILGDFK